LHHLTSCGDDRRTGKGRVSRKYAFGRIERFVEKLEDELKPARRIVWRGQDETGGQAIERHYQECPFRVLICNDLEAVAFLSKATNLAI
jgi:hypothetical protein